MPRAETAFERNKDAQKAGALSLRLLGSLPLSHGGGLGLEVHLATQNSHYAQKT